MVAKKTVAKKSAPKKVSTKKPAAKAVAKVVAKKRTIAKKKNVMRSFRVYKDNAPFIRVGVTRQTLYWSILLAFIVVIQLWILKIQMDIAELTAMLTM